MVTPNLGLTVIPAVSVRTPRENLLAHGPSAGSRARKGSMQLIDNPNVKYSFTTRAVPLEEMAGVVPMMWGPPASDV